MINPLLLRVLMPPRLARTMGYATPLALFALFLLAWRHTVPIGFAVLAGLVVLGATVLLVPPAMAPGLGGMADENAVALVVLLAAAVWVRPSLTAWVLGALALLHAVDPLVERIRVTERRARAAAVGFEAALPAPDAGAEVCGTEAHGPQLPLDEDPYGSYPDSAAEAGVPDDAAACGSEPA